MKKKYYIVAWNSNCWDSFIQHQINIKECYKLKEGYIETSDYRSNPKDNYYISDQYYTRKDFCFGWKDKKDIFTDIEKAQKYAFEKINVMYLSRCKYLIKERDEAIQKIQKKKGETQCYHFKNLIKYLD